MTRKVDLSKVIDWAPTVVGAVAVYALLRLLWAWPLFPRLMGGDLAVGKNSQTTFLALILGAGLIGLWGAVVWIRDAGYDTARSAFSMETVSKMWWKLGSFLAAITTFCGIWWWTIASWGWFMGILLGWIPSLIVAALAGLLWPIALSLGGLAMLWLFLT